MDGQGAIGDYMYNRGLMKVVEAAKQRIIAAESVLTVNNKFEVDVVGNSSFGVADDGGELGLTERHVLCGTCCAAQMMRS